MRKNIIIILPEKNSLSKVSRNKIIKSFLKKSVDWLKVQDNIYNIILNELDNITCIQVYQDNVVRLHLKPKDYFEQKNTSILIEEPFYGEILRETLVELLQ